MNRSQGQYFDQKELSRIVMLLSDSDMAIPAIAKRMECSRSAVAAINHKFQIRIYNGKRISWTNIYGDKTNNRDMIPLRRYELLRLTDIEDVSEVQEIRG